MVTIDSLLKNLANRRITFVDGKEGAIVEADARYVYIRLANSFGIDRYMLDVLVGSERYPRLNLDPSLSNNEYDVLVACVEEKNNSDVGQMLPPKPRKLSPEEAEAAYQEALEKWAEEQADKAWTEQRIHDNDGWI